MLLADTSIWVAHLKNPYGHPELIAGLEQGMVSTHPFIEGELSLSGAPVGELLAGVDTLPVARHDEVLAFVEALERPLRGIGWVDVHLAYSALVHRQELLTLDRHLGAFFARCKAR